jgi:hypothetical protein
VWHDNWPWSIPLIVSTVIIHVVGLGLFNVTAVKDHPRFTSAFSLVIGFTAIWATFLHAIEVVTPLFDVCLVGPSRLDLLTLSFSYFDPKRPVRLPVIRHTCNRTIGPRVSIPRSPFNRKGALSNRQRTSATCERLGTSFVNAVNCFLGVRVRSAVRIVCTLPIQR